MVQQGTPEIECVIVNRKQWKSFLNLKVTILYGQYMYTISVVKMCSVLKVSLT